MRDEERRESNRKEGAKGEKEKKLIPPDLLIDLLSSLFFFFLTSFSALLTHSPPSLRFFFFSREHIPIATWTSTTPRIFTLIATTSKRSAWRTVRGSCRVTIACGRERTAAFDYGIGRDGEGEKGIREGEREKRGRIKD